MPINKNDYALVVGIEHYPNYRDLNGAINDAKDFAKWLTDKETGGGLPDANCKVVLSTPDPSHPVQHAIDNDLRAIFKAIGTGRARRLYLFFSGHGLARSTEETDLCLAIWSDDWRNAALDAQGYLKYVKGSGKFEEVAFFLDCCRMRKINATGLGPMLGYGMPSEVAGSCRSFVANATEFQNLAFEAQVSDTLDTNGPLVRGHFTRVLMAALWGQAAEASGGVRVSRLKEFLEINTPRVAKDHGHIQNVEVPSSFSQTSLFGSARPPEAIDVKVSFKAERQGPIALVGPDNGEIKRDVPASGPWHLSLVPHLHLLVDEGTGAEKSLRLNCVEGAIHVEF